MRSDDDKTANWAPELDQIMKSGLSDGRRAKFLPSVPELIYDWLRFEGYMGNVRYILLGSALGASGAFLIARILGFDILRRWFGDRIPEGFLDSQNTLMAVIFVSRLLPFLSFDVVSYAAGLTSLSFLRFVIATLAGIAPASFLLAHFGSELATGDVTRIAGTVLLLGALTLIPVAVGLRRRRVTAKHEPKD